MNWRGHLGHVLTPKAKRHQYQDVPHLHLDLYSSLQRINYPRLLVQILKMPIVHIVLFKFKEGTEPTVVKDVREASLILSCMAITNINTHKICDRMIGLKNTCVHPQTQKPYMRSYGGGKNNSPEGAAVSPSNRTRVTLLTSTAWPPVRIRFGV